MGKDVDFVADLARQIQAVAPDLAPERVRLIAQGIRHDWGGMRVYVRKGAAEGKAWLLAESLAAGAGLAEAFHAAGVSRTTGYRLLARRTRGNNHKATR
jgi:hypothetical protein